jgi:hypothetical protein
VTRRPTYVASLEAHIDGLHAQLIGLGLYPVPYAQLGPFKGLHATAARSIIAGLQHDGEELRAKLGEVERAVSPKVPICTTRVSTERDANRT